MINERFIKCFVFLIALLFAIHGFAQDSRLDIITNYSHQTRLMKNDIIPDSVFKMTNLKSLSITGMDCDFIVFNEQGKTLLNVG